MKEKFKKKVTVKHVFVMRFMRSPLYQIITESDITPKSIQNKVKIIWYTKIEWSRYYTIKKAIQCHRSQKWGHTTSNRC